GAGPGRAGVSARRGPLVRAGLVRGIGARGAVGARGAGGLRWEHAPRRREERTRMRVGMMIAGRKPSGCLGARQLYKDFVWGGVGEQISVVFICTYPTLWGGNRPARWSGAAAIFTGWDRRPVAAILERGRLRGCLVRDGCCGLLAGHRRSTKQLGGARLEWAGLHSGPLPSGVGVAAGGGRGRGRGIASCRGRDSAKILNELNSL
ncbi:hypothetical protein chiPu_0030541, partial [Chiloscyllium punctatum]|nr:hypothetical protein [Chiloscyllium punctatum]